MVMKPGRAEALDRPAAGDMTVSTSSKQIGAVLGPAMVAAVVSESPLVQPDLYAQQIPPVVYMSGLLMLVAGLAIVRAHNRWRLDWTVLVTLAGWGLLGLGLVRMFSASAYLKSASATQPWVFMVIEAALLAAGLCITVMAYRRYP